MILNIGKFNIIKGFNMISAKDVLENIDGLSVSTTGYGNQVVIKKAVENLDSYTVGITNITVTDGYKVTITLRYPWLLVGLGGKDINTLKAQLKLVCPKVEIKLLETKSLCVDKTTFKQKLKNIYKRCIGG